MRIPLDWLKEYLDFNLPAPKVADLLTNSGTETVVLEKDFSFFKDIIVGEILKIIPHSSDLKLKIAILNIGEKKIQVISRAPNLEVGLKVPVILKGKFLGGKKVEVAKFQGVISEGMILSESELGISDDHTGVMVLDASLAPGLSLEKVFKKTPQKEVTLEAEITPQRPDCLSIIGIARELGAILDKKVKYPSFSFPENRDKTPARANDISRSGGKNFFSVEIKAKKLCPKYFARVLKIKENPPSPSLIQSRLKASGLRPINALVDIGNYVMLEMGQPLHVFDGEKIKGRKIIVREAEEEEKIVTIDGLKHQLEKGMCLIADIEKPIALAGIMGGENTEVTPKTKLVVLESATFNPFSVRKTSKKLGIRTEASLRFEKGLWPELAKEAIDRATQLILEICGGKILSGKIEAGEGKTEKRKIKCPLLEIEKKIGLKISTGKIKKIFSHLEIPIKIEKGVLEAKTPAFRPDLKIKEDLLEEIARLYGYDKIFSTFPSGGFSPPPTNRKFTLKERIKELLKSLGYWETYNYSFVSSKLLEDFFLNEKEHLKIKNPITLEHEFMRTTLIPSLFEVAIKNQKNFNSISIFEIAFVYFPFKEKENLVNEVLKIGGLLAEEKANSIFYQAKESLEYLFSELNIKNVIFIPGEENDFFHPFRRAVIKAGKEKLGIIGEIHPSVAEKFKAQKRITAFELDFEAIFNSILPKIFKPLPRFPAVALDLSIIVDEKILTSKIIEEIKKESQLIEKVVCFDFYKGPQIPSSSKSLSFRITYRHLQKTLKDEEAKQIHEQIIKHLSSRFKAKLRE